MFVEERARDPFLGGSDVPTPMFWRNVSLSFNLFSCAFVTVHARFRFSGAFYIACTHACVFHVSTLWERPFHGCSTCRTSEDDEYLCSAAEDVYNDLAGLPQGTPAEIIELDFGDGGLKRTTLIRERSLLSSSLPFSTNCRVSMHVSIRCFKCHQASRWPHDTSACTMRCCSR